VTERHFRRVILANILVIPHTTSTYIACMPSFLQLVIGSFIISPLGSGSDTIKVTEDCCNLLSKDVSTIRVLKTTE